MAETEGVDGKEISDGVTGSHPKIFFGHPNFDFGKIYKGKKVEHVYEFENRGSDTLNIGKVKTSCGCTAVILENSSVEPGKTGVLKATFNSGSYRGHVRKTISVLSNDSDTPNYKLVFSGEIIEEVAINPRNIDFGSIDSEEKAARTVTVTVKSQTDPEFKINKITPSRQFVSASIAEENDGEYLINVTLEDKPKVGRFGGTIVFETNSANQKSAKMLFFGEIISDITTNPQRIYYSNIRQGRDLPQRVFVKINKKGIRIIDTKLTPEFLSFKLIEKYDEQNPHCLIEITFPKDAAIGKLDGLLEIHTNSSKQPVIKIPITGVVEKS